MLKPKYALDQLVFYIENNEIHSAKITSIITVQNKINHSLTEEQTKIFNPAGKSRVLYYISDENFTEDQLFASRNELCNFLLTYGKNELTPEIHFKYDGNDNENYTININGNPFCEVFAGEDCVIDLCEILNNNYFRIKESLG